jgi:D-xylose transport system permease protein
MKETKMSDVTDIPFKPSKLKTARLLVSGNSRWIPMILVAVIVGVSLQIATDGVFLSPRNLTMLMRHGAITSILAMAVAVLIIEGEIDLSIGSAVYLCSTAAATLQVLHGWAVVPTLLATLGIALLLGCWQGLWTVAFGVPSFVVTLGGLLGFRGLAYYLTNAATISPVSPSYASLSEAFIPIRASLILISILYVASVAMILRGARVQEEKGGSTLLKIVTVSIVCIGLGWVFGSYQGIPTAFLWLAGCAGAMHFLMSRTVFGRNIYLIGSNREAARLAGVNVKMHILGGFLLMSVFYAIAGTLSTARLSGSTPALGQYLELDAIAAAVIGGVSLQGGVGSVPGAIAGATLLIIIDNGMSLLDVSSFIQMVVKALLLLLALGADRLFNRK